MYTNLQASWGINDNVAPLPVNQLPYYIGITALNTPTTESFQLSVSGTNQAQFGYLQQSQIANGFMINARTTNPIQLDASQLTLTYVACMFSFLLIHRFI